jgi:hypothetical protein
VSLRSFGLAIGALLAVQSLGGSGVFSQQLSPPAAPSNLRVGSGDGEGLPPGVTLRAIDGGDAYFSAWQNTLPTQLSFFPIAVWFESVLTAQDIDVDQAVGLNTYVVLTGNSDAPLIAARGMHYIAHQGDWLSRPSAAIDGWELDDEVDMRFSPSSGFQWLASIVSRIPADGRFRYANYGKGVTFWLNDADAARYVNEFQHVVSVDNYWFTDNNICAASEGGQLVSSPPRNLTAAECHLAFNYGLTIDRVRQLDGTDGRRQPVWAFVEVGHPASQQEWPSITPPQVRAAVWHSIIAGARGIIYFNHSFGGPCQTQHALRDPCYASVRSVVQTTNQQITELASVLNSSFADGYVTASAGVRVMAKRGPDGSWYVFAGSRQPGAQTATLTIAAGSTVEVLYEGRTRPLVNGQFTDSFADGNAVHIYRITN